MYRNYFLFFILFFCIFSNYIHSRYAGTLLRESLGAYGIAIGGAYASDVKNASAMLWNPAGLAHINIQVETLAKKNTIQEAEKAFQEFEKENKKVDPEYKESLVSSKNKDILFTKKSLFQMDIYVAGSQLSFDRQIGFVGVGISTIRGVLGLGVLGARVTGIEGYDIQGQSTGSLDFSDIVPYLSYGIDIGIFNLGFSLKVIREQLHNTSLWGGALDIGVQFTVAILTVGLSIENIAGIIQENSSGKLDRLDTIINIDSTINIPLSFFKLHLGISSNIDEPTQEGLQFHAGVSLCWSRYYTCLLFGLNHTQPTGGISFNFQNWVELTYAVNGDILRKSVQHQLEVHIKIRKK